VDALTRLRPASDGLLARVDKTLAVAGAAEGHEIWGLIRRGGLLPGDGLACASDWLPPVLAGRAAQLRRQQETQADVSVSLAGQAALSGWEGEAATAFQARLGGVRQELADAHEAGGELAACLDELADWLESARHRLARCVAAALSSAEAVTLTIGTPIAEAEPAARSAAAAAIGAHVLSEVELFWRGGLQVWQRHAARAAAAPVFHEGSPFTSAGLRVEQ
jgi:uncharacterized protein YukE